MISTTDPETMTAQERRQEVAGILAAGLLRHVRMARKLQSSPAKTVSKTTKSSLDVHAKARLSVAQVPAG